MKYKSISGMHDILPGESPKWQFVEQTAREHFALYGHEEIRTPIVEETPLFARSVGELTDIVQKEMYTFEDKDNLSLTLRPEGTASVVRSAIEHNLINQTSPDLKVYYLGPMYRRERPQKGRFRQFHQIGAESFGSKSPYADAEIIEMLAGYLNKVGLKDWALQINSLGCGHERKAYQEKLKGFFAKNEKNFCDDCRQRIKRNPLRVLDCKNPKCRELSKDHPDILDFLEPESRAHFESVKKTLDELKVPYEINPKMVRGLDYYQRTVFEFVSDRLGAQAAIAAGGRYDSLVKDLGGADIPGVGFAIGIERLLMLIGEPKPIASKKIFVAFLGEAAHARAREVAFQIRQNGISCEIEADEKSLKSQLRKADKLACTHVIIIGEEELKQGMAQVKDFSAKTQTNVPLARIVSFFKGDVVD
ncbi:MAG: histidine--tRNA ligase [Deltaproteobacteria bacterium]|nr:histidine--tRNA ligase [Deltaproteobacteria bacterium]